MIEERIYRRPANNNAAPAWLPAAYELTIDPVEPVFEAGESPKAEPVDMYGGCLDPLIVETFNDRQGARRLTFDGAAHLRFAVPTKVRLLTASYAAAIACSDLWRCRWATHKEERIPSRADRLGSVTLAKVQANAGNPTRPISVTWRVPADVRRLLVHGFNNTDVARTLEIAGADSAKLFSLYTLSIAVAAGSMKAILVGAGATTAGVSGVDLAHPGPLPPWLTVNMVNAFATGYARITIIGER